MNKEEYNELLTVLAKKFITNFKKYEDKASKETVAAGP